MAMAHCATLPPALVRGPAFVRGCKPLRSCRRPPVASDFPAQPKPRPEYPHGVDGHLRKAGKAREKREREENGALNGAQAISSPGATGSRGRPTRELTSRLHGPSPHAMIRSGQSNRACGGLASSPGRRRHGGLHERVARSEGERGGRRKHGRARGKAPLRQCAKGRALAAGRFRSLAGGRFLIAGEGEREM